MRYEIGIEMINNGFNKAVKKGHISETTAKTYIERLTNFYNNHLKEIQENATTKKEENIFNPGFWNQAVVDGWFEKLVERYNMDEVSASYVQSSAMAFQKMQKLQKEHKYFDKKLDNIRIGKTGSIKQEEGRLYELHLAGVSISNEDVNVIKPKDDTDFEKILKHLQHTLPEKTDVQKKNKESIINLWQAQRHTGGRLKAELNLKAKDIDMEKGEKFYDKDKNEFSRRVPLREEQRSFYESITENKADGAFLFPILKANGKQMSLDEAEKRVADLVRAAARETGVNHIENDKEQRYTSHSNRRLYAQSLYDGTKFDSKAVLREKIADYINRQGSNKEGILKRIEAEKERLNWYRIKNGLEQKDFTHEQLRRLLVSLHMGHSRIDHIKRYIEPDEQVWNK